MTTPNIPAGLTRDQARAVRDYAARVLADPNYHSAEEVAAARVLLAVLPRPTLADMTANERTECQRMQADVKGYEHPAAIIQTYVTNGSARVMWETLRVEEVSWANITPRPDLPRLQWPGDTPSPSPALPDGWRLADHPDHGRVIVTDDTPGLDGWVYGVFASDMDGTGFDWHPYDPGELTLLDAPAPPNTITLGSKWNDTNALADACEESGRDQITVTDANGYAFIWAYDAEWWEGSAQPIDAPFTIIHTGFDGDDQ